MIFPCNFFSQKRKKTSKNTKWKKKENKSEMEMEFFSKMKWFFFKNGNGFFSKNQNLFCCHGVATRDRCRCCQEYLALRSAHVAALKAAGESPYPHKFHVSISLTDFIQRYESIQPGETLEDVVSLAGQSLSQLLELVVEQFFFNYYFILKN